MTPELAKTLHVAIIFALLYAGFAYVLLTGKLKRFVQKKSKLFLSGKKLKNFYNLKVCFSVSLFIFIIFVVANFHAQALGLPQLWNFGFWLYGGSLFVLLPLAFTDFWSLFLFKIKRFPMRNFLLTFAAFFFIGFAANNLHDFFWCYTVTSGYTQDVRGGTDLGLWQLIFMAEPFYSTFGIYMLFQMILLLSVAYSILYYQFKDIRKFSKLIYSTLIYFVALGTLFYIADFPNTYSGLTLNIVVFLGFPLLAIFVLYMSRRVLDLRH